MKKRASEQSWLAHQPDKRGLQHVWRGFNHSYFPIPLPEHGDEWRGISPFCITNLFSKSSLDQLTFERK